MVTDRDRAFFEAGIKLGALYHQFVGSPISLRTVRSLEKAIEESVALQPFVEEVSVIIDREKLAEAINEEFGYGELRGDMLVVRLVTRVGECRATVGLQYDEELRYPLMYVESVES